jgi:DNA polymerase-4
MGARQRHILHIDMNAFYCSCHAAAEPHKYRGRPTAVAGSPETRHGVVVTASYEARKYGVRATMTVAEALRQYPSLILIHPDFDLYRTYSRKVFALIREYTPQVQIFSIDECWADVTGSRQFGTPRDIAEQIQHRLRTELGLPCSIGIAPNKFLAKMASDFEKPMGITELWHDQLPKLLWPLPVEQMFGVGRKTAERLHRLGIRTISDLAHANPESLQRYFGKRAFDMVQRANGIDHSEVNPVPEPLKSIGHSITMAEDVVSVDELCTVLLNLSDQVGRRVRKHGLVGRTVQITIRYANRETITRAKTLPAATCVTERIYETARELLLKHRRANRPVRLLGVSLGQLTEPEADAAKPVQLQLFSDEPAADPLLKREHRLKKLNEVTDVLRNKYGEDIVVRGRILTGHESSQIRNHKIRGTSLQKDNLHDEL